MFDWNNNGKYDMQDAFINYHIHRSIFGNKQNQSSSGASGDTSALPGFFLAEICHIRCYYRHTVYKEWCV